ncbi:MAG TPA: hypothetical protein VFJ85_14630 [Acidimicrobiales bacterium]|nr:hypothetical protein [Acidimicrobiales bacterium]
MTAVALASARGAPGVTITVLALAGAWPAGRRLVVVEADPAGGELSCRFGLAAEPNVVTLAADARGGLGIEGLLAHAQHLAGRPGAEVVVAPVDARQTGVALSVLCRSGLPALLAGVDDLDVLVDLGRLAPESPALELFAAASVPVLVARAELAQAAHLRQRIAWLGGRAEVGLAVVGEGRWPAAELARSVGAAGVVGVLPDDPRAAAALGGGMSARGLTRSALSAAARAMADRLVAGVEAAPVEHNLRPVETPPAPAEIGGGRRWD